MNKCDANVERIKLLIEKNFNRSKEVLLLKKKIFDSEEHEKNITTKIEEIIKLKKDVSLKIHECYNEADSNQTDQLCEKIVALNKSKKNLEDDVCF